MVSNPIDILIDTNIIRLMGFNKVSDEFRYLHNLQDAGKVSLLISEITLKEASSQMKQQSDSHVQNLFTSLSYIHNDPSLLNACQSVDLFNTPATKLSPASIHEKSTRLAKEISKITESYESQVKLYLKVNVLPITHEDTKNVFSDYFSGEGNFSKIKSKSDIPDAYIYHCYKRNLQAEAQCILVTNDKLLNSSAAKLQGGIALNTISELLEWLKNKGISTDELILWGTSQPNILQWLKEHYTDYEPSLHKQLTDEISRHTYQHGMFHSPQKTVRLVDAAVNSISPDWKTFRLTSPGVFTFEASAIADVAIINFEFDDGNLAIRDRLCRKPYLINMNHTIAMLCTRHIKSMS